ncbi:beta-1,3-galactosyltransferase 5-like [Dermacentor albipictus]|uniref:beta-1,3-galactosyltransferase 5-like n=1 Tax=Dermacentor albipictus TaxID=60249 RepID=UPI0038FC97D0
MEFGSDHYILETNFKVSQSRIKEFMFIEGDRFRKIREEPGKDRAPATLEEWYYGSTAGSWVPVYLSGAAYVMSGAIVGPMLRKALQTPALHHENVFLTGIVASELHLRLFNSPCFACCDELADPCAYRALLAATVAKPDSLYTAWRLARGQTAEACCPLNGTDRRC